ncbi:hypothetical protein C0J52_22374 [Blattella germanica]|nr:hypothetical protein C0J52_22374 [Blattella germanica]
MKCRARCASNSVVDLVGSRDSPLGTICKQSQSQSWFSVFKISFSHILVHTKSSSTSSYLFPRAMMKPLADRMISSPFGVYVDNTSVFDAQLDGYTIYYEDRRDVLRLVNAESLVPFLPEVEVTRDRCHSMMFMFAIQSRAVPAYSLYFGASKIFIAVYF